MVLKRWSYILIAAWLINALVCFHPTHFTESNGIPVPQSFSSKFSDNTLIDIFFNHVTKDNDQHEHHKINFRNRFLNSRSLDFNIQLPFSDTFQYLALVKTIPPNHFIAWENRIFLPPLHHFLFRLSPF